MKDNQRIAEEVMREMDDRVADLGKEDYLEVLQELQASVEIRIEAVNAEMEDEGIE